MGSGSMETFPKDPVREEVGGLGWSQGGQEVGKADAKEQALPSLWLQPQGSNLQDWNQVDLGGRAGAGPGAGGVGTGSPQPGQASGLRFRWRIEDRNYSLWVDIKLGV